jgi:hypothetical protein
VRSSPKSEIKASVAFPPADWDAALHHAFELALCLLRARRGALYAVRGEALWLVKSDRLDQAALATAADAWSRARNTLLAGTPVEGRGQPNYVLLPCLADADLRGVLYVEPLRPVVLERPHLATFAAVLGRALSALAESKPRAEADSAPVDPATSFEGTLGRDCAPDKLKLLLERNEWNIARVARLVGITRMTVYKRLRDARIQRVRVRRSPRPKRRKAGSASLPGGASVEPPSPAGAPPVREGLAERYASLARADA